MPAAAGKLDGIACIAAIRAAVLAVVGCTTVASWMSAFLISSHELSPAIRHEQVLMCVTTNSAGSGRVQFERRWKRAFLSIASY